MTRAVSLPWLLLLPLTLLLPSSITLADTLPLTTEGEEDEEDEKSEEEDEELPPWAEPKSEGEEEDKGEEAATEDEESDTPADETEQPASEDDEEDSQSVPAPSASWKGGGAVGLGFLIGTDNGLSLKLWPSRMHGVHIHIAAPTRLNALSVGFAYQLHLASIGIPGSKVHLHPSIGPSFRLRAFIYENGAYVDGQVGASIGMSITVSQVPAEIFFEVIPGFAFGINIPGVGLGFDVGGHVGARFYFGK
jgi:hypothetical protein